jgi:hypothetical protein
MIKHKRIVITTQRSKPIFAYTRKLRTNKNIERQRIKTEAIQCS